ncbi:hypothetical protein ABZ851_00415 [Streptomyces sp. NPDC047049]|uniref:hypothetical protein n=1 Tax=Streptomyces sp. NPDC047049 TaxID=3156688 RepID=UPI0033CE6457
MNTDQPTQTSPRGRLREALLGIGERGDVSEADLGDAVTGALRELGRDVLGERSRVGLVTVGAEDDSRGRRVGLRLADHDTGLPDLLWYADESGLPSEVRESCPTLSQEEWEAGLLVAKLVLTVLESEPGPVPGPGTEPVPADVARCRPHAPRPARSIPRERCCRALAAMAERRDPHPAELTARLRTTLLEFASETPDNKEAVQHIAVRSAEPSCQGARWRLGGSGFAFTQVLLSAEGWAVPSCVRGEFPDVTQEEWTAVIQVTALVLLAFEGGR